MGISELGGWLKQQLEGKSPFEGHPILDPGLPKRPPSIHQTIQPNVPLPSFRQEANGGYSVQNLPPGTSTFAPMGPLVLKNPGRGLPRFDPTGTYNDNNLPSNMNNFLLMPMAQPQFQQFEYLKPIGGF